jgi:lysozyme
MTRDVPQLCLDFLEGVEACVLTAYRDAAGVWTIGIGHTGAEVAEGQTISKGQALAWLAQDACTAAGRLSARVHASVLASLSDHQYSALISFVFNLGAAPAWTIWKVLNAGRLDQVPGQMLRFVNAGGREVPGLIHRRMAEVALWNTLDAARAAAIACAAAQAPPPSSAIRVAATPPTPAADAKPIVASKTLWAGATTATTGAIAGVTQIQQLAAPQAQINAHLGKLVAACAGLIVALGVAVMVFRWLDERAKRT